MAHFIFSQFKASRFGWTMALLCASLTIGGAIGSSVPLPAVSQITSVKPMRRVPTSSVLNAIRRDIANRFGVQKVKIISAAEQDWSDSCLALPKGQEECTAAIVPGWRIQVRSDFQTWTYRTDRTGNLLRREGSNQAVLPEVTARKLIQHVAKETNQPADPLIITSVNSEEFNGCLGIYKYLNQPCTANLIYGWKVIVKDQTQHFVYHLDRDANRVILNPTASGAKSTVYVSFDPFGMVLPPIASNVIFSSTSVKNTMDQTMSIVLTKDGKITQYQSSPTGKFAPRLLKTLTANQVNAFSKVLDDQRFPNLNGLNYLTASSLANFETTTYQAQSVSTQVMDSEKKGTPRSLQSIIKSWETLTRPSNSPTVKLQQLLTSKNWAAADQETRRLLNDINNVPDEVIRSIDQAWLIASNNRFGLSVQAKIWRESLAKHPKDREAAIRAFRDRVGWKLTQARLEDDFISSDWLNESELNYTTKAPTGHLPWAGVADQEVYDLLKETTNGCGSCTTDAMQLRNERFYTRLPMLFKRVQTAIAASK